MVTISCMTQRDISFKPRGCYAKFELSPILAAGNTSHREVVNANGSAGSSMGQGASRLAKALQYKQTRSQPASVSDKAALASAEQSNGASSSSAKQTTDKVR